MPNPYDDIFEESGEENKKLESSKLEETSVDLDRFVPNDKEPLDEIVDNLQLFQSKAETFSQLLSSTKAIDHKVTTAVASIFIVDDSPERKFDLKGERQYHKLLKEKFNLIINPMRDLAEIHLATVKQFNRDINENYYSIEKTDHTINIEKSRAIDGINIQRKILADATNDLYILKDALESSEKRIKKFINAGGINNISSSEYEIITQKSSTLTSGQDCQFDYSIFHINFLDKTVITLGGYMKETSSQYFGKLLKAFEIR